MFVRRDRVAVSVNYDGNVGKQSHWLPWCLPRSGSDAQGFGYILDSRVIASGESRRSGGSTGGSGGGGVRTPPPLMGQHPISRDPTLFITNVKFLRITKSL